MVEQDKKSFLYATFLSLAFVSIPWVILLDGPFYFSDQFTTIEKFTRIQYSEKFSLDYFLSEKLYNLIYVKIIKLISFFREDIITVKIFQPGDPNYNISRNSELAFYTISYFCTFIWIIFLQKNKIPIMIIAIYLIHPFAIDVSHSIIQNALSFSFILIGLMTNNKFIKSIFYLLSPLIHNSAILVLIIIFVNKYVIQRSESKNILIGISLIVVLGLSFCVFFLDTMIASNEITIGKKLARENLISPTKLIFFVILLAMQMMSSLNYLKHNLLMFQIIMITAILSAVNPHVFRYIICLYPLILVSIWNLTSDKKYLTILFWLINLVFIYLGWSGNF